MDKLMAPDSNGVLRRVASLNQDRLDYYHNEIDGGLTIPESDKSEYRLTFYNDIESFLSTYSLPYHRLVLPSGNTLQFYFPTKSVALHLVPFFDNAMIEPGQIRNQDKKRWLESVYLEGKNNNIRVITIMDYHWYSRPEKVKGVLDHALSPVPHKVFARKCDIHWLDRKLAAEFLKKYHIDGNSGSASWALGLTLKGEEPSMDTLLQVTTWSGPRMGRGDKLDIELARMANRRGYTVVGGTSKMFKTFIETVHPKSILSYHDNTLFDGSGYEAVGMQDEGQTGPSYGYCRYDGSMCKTWIHRETIQVHKLRTAFPQLTLDIEESHRNKDGKYLPGMEFSIASSLGLYASNDAGNTRHRMKFDEEGWQVDINDGHRIKKWW